MEERLWKGVWNQISNMTSTLVLTINNLRNSATQAE